jgi:predicted ATPase/DNA-binding winged helix-turn-helix (wHTH) protein
MTDHLRLRPSNAPESARKLPNCPPADPASEAPASVEFGRFRVSPHRRELLADGRPVKLGGRALDVLMALIDARGVVVAKNALMARVWPDRIVEENSLQSQISALRAALGAERDLIRTVSGRGYQFTGEIRTVTEGPHTQAVAGTAVRARAPPHPTNLPAPVSELIGRDAELEEILRLTATHRLVTLTGAGGIGKTRLGLEVARQLLPKFADGVWAIELAPLSDPDLVSATVATALGLDPTDDVVSPERVANALASKQLLLLLDNCEHLVGAAASMAEALLRANPAAHVMATSREPLRAEGECLHPVPPLAVPTEGGQDAEDPLQYGAMRLFVVRARAAVPQFSLDGNVAATIATICRHLDGIPLAIELAAARTTTLGVEELASHLDDCFDLLTGGRRTALPRHQTLRATLDWSYELLPEPERMVLRRLAIFAGGFTLQAASTVTAIGEIAGSDIVDCAANLVAKSLVAADFDGATAWYRLLETTRAYALEKLTQSGEFEQVSRRHAEYYRDLLEQAKVELKTRPASEWLAAYGREIGNLRAALYWAFSPTGDVAVGVALTIAAVPLWGQLSLVQECRVCVERALASLEPEAGRGASQEMKLYAALGASVLLLKGPIPETEEVWAKALEIAESLSDPEYQLRALLGLWACRMGRGEFRVALKLTQRVYSLAQDRDDPAELAMSDRIIGGSLHYCGDQTNARHHIERMLSGDVAPDQRSPLPWFQLCQRVVARVALARVLWLQGFPEQARRTAQSAVDDARALNHMVSLCLALCEAACPVALFTGDLAAAEGYAVMLLERSAAHALPFWRAGGHSFHATLLIRKGDVDTGLRLLRIALEQAREASFQPSFTWFLGELAAGLGHTGQIAQGLEAIDQALARSRRNEERWCTAELLRIRGELLLLQEGSGAGAAAEDHYHQALGWARRQGALSWELRAAMSLARLLRDQARPADAMALLQPVFDRFTEGFDTADLEAAKALLDALAGAAGRLVSRD